MREISWVVCGSGPPPRRRRERCLTSRLLALASRWSIMNVLTDAVPLFFFLFFKFSVAPIFFSLFFFWGGGEFCPAVWTEGRQTESWSVAHLSYSVTDVGSNNKQQKEKKKGKNELIIFFFCHKVYILFFHTDLQVTKTKRSSSVFFFFFYDDDDYDLCSHLPTTFLPWK